MNLCFAEGFQTDTQISSSASGGGSGGLNGEMRQLERWVGDEDDDSAGVDLSLGGGDGENGWRAEEMFEKNRVLYNVGTSFKSNLEGYTVPLNRDSNSEEYK